LVAVALGDVMHGTCISLWSEQDLLMRLAVGGKRKSHRT
jgi:hypothetical protein